MSNQSDQNNKIRNLRRIMRKMEYEASNKTRTTTKLITH